jgi:predicted transcriptional regulator of viral defense system
MLNLAFIAFSIHNTSGFLKEHAMATYKEKARHLYETVSDQGGYFTTKQAQAAGYAPSTHSYNVKAGNWVREHRGIYRLANYPTGEHPDMVLWHLWSRNQSDEPQGVFSHQTALSFYDLSDVNPAKLHMTVPPAFRRGVETPKILVLHRGKLRKEDVQEAQGFRVTRPLRTIVDLLIDRTVQMDHMGQAVKQSFARGLITGEQVEGAAWVAAGIKKQIEELRHG